MADAAKRAATYADIEALPPHVVGEILFGRLVTHPRPARRHVVASSAVGGILSSPFQFGSGGPGGWIFADEPELHLGPHIVVPDIAGWRRERMTEPADRAWFEVTPDWVCEVMSPSTERHDKGDKRQIYALYKVAHLWHVDPRARSLEVFTRQDESWLLLSTFFENDDVSAQPFADITFPLGRLWPLDPPSQSAT